MNSLFKESGILDEFKINGGYKSNRGSSIQQELDKYTRKLAETQIRSVTRGNISAFRPS